MILTLGKRDGEGWVWYEKKTKNRICVREEEGKVGRKERTDTEGEEGKDKLKWRE